MSNSQQNTNGAEFDFAHLHIDEKTTRRYGLGLVAPGAWIEGRAAQPDINPAYRDGILSIPDKVERVRRELATGGPDADERAMQREEDYKLLPTTVVTAWHGIRDKNGNLVPFSAPNVEKFFRALPVFLFDRIALFFKSIEVFTLPTQVPPREALKDTAGNS